MRTNALPALATMAFIMVVAFGWRFAAAWWYDDFGNLALARSDAAVARERFDAGLRYVPGSALLLEDRGRAELDSDPAAALRDFQEAACGAPCEAEMGDAQARLGNAGAAVADYLDAKAARRLAALVDRIASQGKYDQAIALETALTRRLGNSILLRADLGAAEFKIGTLSEAAAYADSRRAAAYRPAAIAAYTRASELAPYNEGYLLSLAFAHMKWGDTRVARAAFHRILALHPHQADAEAALARLQESTSSPGH